jgi:hypothetical protein
VDLQYTYNKDRFLTSIKDALSNKIFSFKYDSAGNRIEMIDANAGKTTYTYDALNRLVSVVDPNGQTTVYSPPVSKKGNALLNEVISAYNFNSPNRLLTMIISNPPEGIIAKYDFKFPVVRYETKAFEANKRWYGWVEEETKDKRGYLRIQSPFEIIK